MEFMACPEETDFGGFRHRAAPLEPALRRTIRRMTPPEDPRACSPAAERNKQPILEVLQRVLRADGGDLLEIACGSGQHAAHFAAALPAWTWWPSDANPQVLPSVRAWVAEAGLANVRAPLHLDVTSAEWPVGQVDAIYCANMLHASPWATCRGLMEGAARHLREHGLLVTYGPYLLDDAPTAPSNLAFDADLRGRNPAWGLRRLADVLAEAQAAGLALRQRFSMPANNLMLVFTRSEA
jgi:SAM-dependent methyltransferase